MNLKQAFLRGCTPFALSWISLLSSILYMATQRYSNDCDSKAGIVAHLFFFSIGIVGLAGAINKSGFDNAAHFIERVVKVFNPFEDGIVEKFIKSKSALCSVTIIIIVLIVAIALKPESLKAVTWCTQNIISKIEDSQIQDIKK